MSEAFGAEDDETPGEEEAKPRLSQIDELLSKCKDDDWQLKGLARNIVRAKGEVPWSDKTAFEKAVNTEKGKLVKRFAKKELDPFLLKRMDVRVVGVLAECSVKTPKPRPDGSVGEKWAILGVDDGTGLARRCATRASGSSSTREVAEGAVEQLVVVCGEIARRTVYAKEDVHKEHPSPATRRSA